MTILTYDPDKYQVAAGNYLARLKEVKDKPPFQGPSKFGNASTEPRLGWQFEVIGPAGDPSIGKILEQGTGTYPSPRSGLVRLLMMLMGRAPQPKEQIDLNQFIGRQYQVLWAVNPKSDSGNLYVASLMEIGKSPMANSTPPGAATPPATAQRAPVPTPPKPPAPRSSPPAQAAPAQSQAAQPEPSYWVQVGEAVVEMSRTELRVHVNAAPGGDDGKLAEDTIAVMAHDQTGGWKTPKDFGIEAEIRF